MGGQLEGIVKQAILLEQRGRDFYRGVATQAEAEAVREIFATMAEEEERHIQALAELGKTLLAEEGGSLPLPQVQPALTVEAVLTDEVKRGIREAGYEAAAIYAAMALEEKAVAFYSEQARASQGEVAKLFSWLADWERTHLELLMALDEDLR